MIKRRLTIICACLFSGLTLLGQNRSYTEQPKLVVGIVVDQMRWDYLQRFYHRFTEGGFKRIISEGFSCNNTQLNYIPTVTAVGHSAIYTGSVPAISGIAGNNFYVNGHKVYCTEDSTVHTIGSESKEGHMSPHYLQVTTIGDELKLSNNFKSKVIGISLKDRASILPAGHSADAAYWLDDETGRFITSSFYQKKLPEWVKKFNANDWVRILMKNDWNTLYPSDSYNECTADDNNYERAFVKGEKPVFPILTSKLFQTEGYSSIRTTPYGNTLTLKMAKAALEGEKLGQENRVDLLAISLSSTDYIGHQFGTYAIETADTYYRLDKDLGDFINYLDEKVGRDHYVLFLTADHAAAHNFLFMKQHKMPADGWDVSKTQDELNEYLHSKYKSSDKLVKDVMNYQVFFDKDLIQKAGLDYTQVKRDACRYLSLNPTFAWVCDMENLNNITIPEPIKQRIINGYNRERSGDIQIIMKPGCYKISVKKGLGGTEHGVWNPYDAHIPLLFFGSNIRQGSSYDLVNMTDIAPTICALLGIQTPNGCVGTAINSIIHNK